MNVRIAALQNAAVLQRTETDPANAGTTKIPTHNNSQGE